MSWFGSSNESTLSRRFLLASLGTLVTTATGVQASDTTANDLRTTKRRTACPTGGPFSHEYPAIYQYYHTDWTTITDDLAAIADAGYGAIQLPPAQRSALTRADQNDDDHPPLGYQPVDHRTFDSEFGTETEYATLVDEAHAHDLDVIADAVMNHMAGGRGYDFPAFSYGDFHHDGGIDYDDPDSVENGDLLGLPDLDQSSEYVRTQLENYLEKYATIGERGVDAIRYDAAKHIPERFFERHANHWANEHDLYRFGEVLHGANYVCDDYARTGMSVMDYPLYFFMKEDAFHATGDLRTLETAGYVRQDPTTMTFVSNHDTTPPEHEKLAYAYILTIEGQPRVYNDRIDVTDDDVKNLLWIRNNLAYGPTITRHASKPLYVFERLGSLIVGLNRSTNPQTQRVQTSWTNTLLHDYTNHGTDVTTDPNGTVELDVPPTSWVCYSEHDQDATKTLPTSDDTPSRRDAPPRPR